MEKMQIAIQSAVDIPILTALKVITNYSNLNFDKVGQLRDMFHEHREIDFEISTAEVETLISNLKSSGFDLIYTDKRITIMGWEDKLSQ